MPFHYGSMLKFKCPILILMPITSLFLLKWPTSKRERAKENCGHIAELKMLIIYGSSNQLSNFYKPFMWRMWKNSQEISISTFDPMHRFWHVICYFGLGSFLGQSNGEVKVSIYIFYISNLRSDNHLLLPSMINIMSSVIWPLYFL